MTSDQAGGFCACGAGLAPFTRGETIDAVRAHRRAAVARHDFDRPGNDAVGTTFRLPKVRTERAIDRLRVG